MSRRLRGSTSVWLFVVFLLLAGVLHMIGNAINASDYYTNALLFCIHAAIYFGLVLFGIISVRERLRFCCAKRHMVYTAAFMLLFLVLCAARFRIAPPESLLSRYCWYTYHLLAEMIPTLFLMSSASFARESSNRQNQDEHLLLIPAHRIIAGVRI